MVVIHMQIDITFIGKRIAQKRNQMKLTQNELAEKTNLTTKFISSIENAHSAPSIESLMKLCEVLDTDPNYILFGITKEKVLNPKIDEIINYLSLCTSEQLEKILEYVELLTRK